MSEFDSIWEKKGNPFRGRISKSQFLGAWDQWLVESGSTDKKLFMKWLITEKFPDLFTIEDDNSSILRKRDEETIELFSVQKAFAHLLEKRQTPSQKEAKERKDRWEHGVKGLVGRQKRLVETGGLKDHIVGVKHEIPRLGAEEVRRIPKSIPTRPNSTQKYIEAERQSYAKQLIEQPDPVRAGQWNKAMVLGINTEAISEARRKLGKD